MLVNTNAIVLSALKYGEADLIVKCYTQKSGIKTYILRGVLKSKKGKFKISLFQPLTQLELVARHKDKGSMEYIQDVRLVLHYKTLHTDVVKGAIVLFLAEILRSAIQEEEENAQLYSFLEHTINWMDNNDNIANFHLLFMLKLTRYLGFSPDDSSSGGAYFNMLDGVFQEVKTNVYCIEGTNMVLLKQLLGTNFDALESIKLTKTIRSGFLTMLINYYQLHIDSFKKPKSLTVLNETFH